MITVEKAESYRCCNSCSSNDGVIEITALMPVGKTKQGTQIALCDKCMRDLVNKIIGFWHEQECER